METLPDPSIDTPRELREREAAADAFERAWLEGRRPDLRDFVGDLSNRSQRKLLEAILPLDWEYRAETGDTPTAADYVAIWPGEQSFVHGILSRAKIVTREADDPMRTRPYHGAERDVVGSSSSRLPIGGAIGEYELLRELGRGGMGVVYLARHRRLNRLTALKVMRSGVASTDEERRRFHAEAAAAAQLDHPGIVPVFEAGEHDSRQFLALAYVEGRTLGDRIKEGPLPPREAAALIERVASAIDYAHARGIVHRDIKPQNILVSSDGRPRVADFGLAKSLATDADLTATGQILGTPSYMAPEQATGEPKRVGPSADIHSLGATLYCALSGRPPFQAATIWETLRLVQQQEPVPLREYNPGLDRDLETICLKSLQKSPSQRYATAKEMAEDLRRYLAGEPILARRLHVAERAWRWCRRNPWIVAVIASLVLLATVSTWAWVRQSALTNEKATLVESETRLRRRAERQLHYTQVARGTTAIDAKNFRGADAALDDRSPLELRGWDYRYLRRQRLGTPLSLVVPPSPVVKVAFSRDGARFATGSLLGDVSLWNQETAALLAHFELPGGSIAALRFHPRRRRLIAAGLGGAVGVWDFDSPETPVRTWRAHPRRLLAADLSPDGARLVTGGDDGTAKVWNLESGDESPIFGRHSFPVHCVSFHPDGQTIVSAAASGQDKFELKVWNADTGEVVEEATGRFHALQGAAFSPDGARVATVTGQNLTIWSRGPLKEDFAVDLPGAATSLAWSPDGTRLAITSLDGTVRVCDATQGKIVREFGHHAEHVLGAEFSPDGYRLASVSGQLDREVKAPNLRPGQLKIWDLRTPTEEANIAVDERDADPVTNYLNALAFQPGTTIVATGGWRKVVRLVDVATGNDAAPEIPFGGVILDLAFHPTEPILVMAGTISGAKGGLALYDARTRELTFLRGHGGSYVSAKLSPDGEFIASVGDDGVVKLWRTRTGKEHESLVGHKSPDVTLAFSPDSRRLFSSAGSKESGIAHKVWDVRTGRELATDSGDFTPQLPSPDGEFYVGRRPDGVIEVWNAADRSLRRLLRGHSDDVTGLVFTPDGKRLISSSRDRTIRVWDHREGVEVLQLVLTTDVPNNVAIADDGALLACATQFGAVRLFDARGTPEALALIGHTATVASFGFTQDGRLLSRDQEGRLLEWTLPEGSHRAISETIDLAPLPVDSRDGNWRVEVDRLDTTILRAMKRSPDPDVYSPWKEAAHRSARHTPKWHAEDARAAEERGDWFAAAFHLARLRWSRKDDADVATRLARALDELKSRNVPLPWEANLHAAP